MRRFVYALLAAYWLMCALLYPRLPARIPRHFNIQGQPDAWTDNPAAFWFLLPLVGTVLVLLMFGAGALSRRVPHLWNVPEKRTFLTLSADQREPIVRRLLSVIDLAALYTLLILVVVQSAMFRVAVAGSGSFGVMFHIVLWGGLVVLMIYSIRLHGEVKQMVRNAAGLPS